MGSYFRDYYSPTATQRPTVGDTKFSVVNQDHMGWLKCDGRLVSTDTYNFLFQVIGYSFGGSGSQFALPNAQGRVPGAVGTSTDNTWVLGDLSGQESHTLTIGEMPAHKHGSVDVSGNTNGNGMTDISGEHTHTNNSVTGSLGLMTVTGDNTASTGLDSSATEADLFVSPQAVTIDSNGAHHHKIGSTGGGAAHNNMQPTIFMGNMFVFSGKVRASATNYYPYAIGTTIF
jgi:microcystin-dependent protein